MLILVTIEHPMHGYLLGLPMRVVQLLMAFRRLVDRIQRFLQHILPGRLRSGQQHNWTFERTLGPSFGLFTHGLSALYCYWSNTPTFPPCRDTPLWMHPHTGPPASRRTFSVPTTTGGYARAHTLSSHNACSPHVGLTVH